MPTLGDDPSHTALGIWYRDVVQSWFMDPEVVDRVDRLELPFNHYGVDSFGVSKQALARAFSMAKWFYENYFSVEVHGLEHVPKRGRAMLVGNHAGGVALDAGTVIASMFFEMDPPRLAQGMAEKFINRMPFLSSWTAKTGQVTGLPEHAKWLLRHDRLLVVFPEGAQGTAKLYTERHSLVDFGTGFLRIALQTGTPIIPLGFIGGGEAIPTVFNAYKLGKLVGAPYVPITPYLAPIPLPVRLSVHYGEPMVFPGNGMEEDEVIERWVGEVKQRIASLIDEGLRQRGEKPVHGLSDGEVRS